MNMLRLLKALNRLWLRLPRIVKARRKGDEPMVRIRLRRQGAKNQPSYRIVVIDQRKARDGKYIENIGYYNPRTDPPTEVVNEDRALYWLSVGAQPSDAVRRTFVHTGTWERFQRLRIGEALEDLVREANDNRQEPPSQKTSRRFDDSESRATPDLVTKPIPEPEPILESEPEPIPEPAPETEPIANPIPDPPSEPEPAPVLVVDESPQPDDGVITEPSDEAPENKDLLYGDVNQPGMTELVDEFVPPSPSADPGRRAYEARKRLVESRRSESVKEQRVRQMMIKVWDGKDPVTREFLVQQYGGKCQICGDFFPKRDGKPYFEALYIESYNTANWLDNPANTLCLCPNHLARFLHGSREFQPDFRSQVAAYQDRGEYEIELSLCGDKRKIKFSESHIIELKALVGATENGVNIR